MDVYNLTQPLGRTFQMMHRKVKNNTNGAYCRKVGTITNGRAVFVTDWLLSKYNWIWLTDYHSDEVVDNVVTFSRKSLLRKNAPDIIKNILKFNIFPKNVKVKLFKILKFKMFYSTLQFHLRRRRCLDSVLWSWISTVPSRRCVLRSFKKSKTHVTHPPLAYILKF